jgi:hypothetical protein
VGNRTKQNEQAQKLLFATVEIVDEFFHLMIMLFLTKKMVKNTFTV